MKRWPILSLLLLNLLASSLRASDVPADWQAVLDHEGFKALFSPWRPSNFIETQDVLQGASAVGLGATSLNGGARLDHNLFIDVEGPGVVVFYAKGRGFEASALKVGEGTAVTSDKVEAGNGWWRVRCYVPSGTVNPIIPLQFFKANVDPSEVQLLVDKLSYRPHYWIDAETPFASVSLTPQKAGYVLGDVVRCVVEPKAGFRLSELYRYAFPKPAFGLAERHLEHPDFYLQVEGHERIEGAFEQSLDFEGLQAWAPLAFAPVLRAEDGSYAVNGLIIEEAFQGGALSFEVETSVAGSGKVLIDGSNGQTEQRIKWTASEGAYQRFEVPLPRMATRISILFGDYSLPASLSDLSKITPRSVRNLRHESVNQVLYSKVGEGSVEVSYDDTGSDGLRSATLKAIPDSGWVFLGWSGSIESNAAELTFPLSQYEQLVATFGREFSFEGSKWTFVPQGPVSFTQSPSDPGGALLSVETSEYIVALDVRVTFDQRGKVSPVYRGVSGAPPSLGDRPVSLEYFEGNLSLGSASVFDVSRTTIHGTGTIYVGSGAPWSLLRVRDPSSLPELKILAPEGSVRIVPSQEAYHVGDIVRLEVVESYRSAFEGWRGYVFSNEYEYSFELAGDTRVEAVFGHGFATTAYSQAMVFGPSEWTLDESSGTPVFSGRLAAGAWGEFIFDLEGSGFLGYRLNGGEVAYAALPGTGKGPLRLAARNEAAGTADFSLEILGFFQSLSETLPSSPDFTLSPELEMYPVGSQLVVTPRVPVGYAFAGWSGASGSLDGNLYTVKRDESIFFEPVFVPDLGVPHVAYLHAEHAGWTYLPLGSLFAYERLLSSGESVLLAFEVEGPGVIGFDSGYAEQKIVYRIDGEVANAGNWGVLQDAQLDELLVDAGIHRVQLEFSLDSENYPEFKGIRPSLAGVSFAEGYIVAEALAGGRDFSLAPVSSNHLYASGSVVDVSIPQAFEGETFLGWTGPFDGQPQQFSFAVDRHVLTNPKFNPVSSIGPVAVHFSGDVVGFHSEGSLFLESASGPVDITFDIPAGTELSFELGLSKDSPVGLTLIEDGVVRYEGDLFSAPFGFAAKASAYQAKVHLEFDPQDEVQVRFHPIRALQRFALVRAFGEGTKYVTADPFKEFYNPGETVRILFKDDAPDDYVFYDLVTAYPNIDDYAWERSDFVASYTIEMKSDTVVGGRVGPRLTRSLGDFASSDGLSLATVSGAGPHGESVIKGTLNSGEEGYFRIYAKERKHVAFWAKIAEGQLWLLENEIDGEPVVLEGDGQWGQVSLAIPEGKDYFDVFVEDVSAGSRSFEIADLKLLSGYGINFITEGPGSVRMEPEGGVANLGETLTLTAVPAEGVVLRSWGDGSSPDVLQRSVAADRNAFLALEFGSETDVSIGFEYAGKVFEVVGDAPALVEYPSYVSSPWTAIEFAQGQLNAGMKLRLESPQTIAIDLNMGFSFLGGQSYSLTVKIDDAVEAVFHSDDLSGLSRQLVHVPAGSHEVTFLMERSSTSSAFNIRGLEFIEGYAVDVAESTGGRVVMDPRKSSYAPGESITLIAVPQAGYRFVAWSGDAVSESPSLELSVEKHLRLAPLFAANERSVRSGNLLWTLSASHGNGTSDFRTTVEGPGVYKSGFGQGIRVDGGTIASYDWGQGRLYLIPEGPHELTAVATTEAGLSGHSYELGFGLVALGDVSALSIEPKRATYGDGEVVTIGFHEAAMEDAGVIARIDGVAVDPSLPLSIELRDHRVFTVDLMKPVGDSDYLSNYPDAGVTLRSRPGQLFELESVELRRGAGLSSRSVLERQFDGMGELRFSLGNLLDADRIELWVDGQLALNVSIPEFPIRAKELLLRVPPQGARIQWIVRSGGASPGSAGVYLDFIEFAAREPSSMERWLASKVPASSFAVSDQLGENDDFDFDGFSNAAELNRGSDPGSFDMDLWFGHGLAVSGDELELRFELPVLIPTEAVLIRSLVSGLASDWSERRLVDLPYLVEAAGSERVRYSVPLDSLDPNARVHQVALELDPEL